MGLGDIINLYRIQKLYSQIRKGIDNPKLLNTKEYWIELYKTAITIKEIREMLKGYRTYIIAAIIAILAGLHAMGYIDEATYQTLLALLGAGGLSTVAAKIGRIQADVKNNELKRELVELNRNGK